MNLIRVVPIPRIHCIRFDSLDSIRRTYHQINDSFASIPTCALHQHDFHLAPRQPRCIPVMRFDASRAVNTKHCARDKGEKLILIYVQRIFTCLWQRVLGTLPFA